MGIDDDSGGIDLTQIAISQPIPLGRLSRQRKQAKARLEAANQNLFYQQLLQEAETARRFHTLQLTTAQLKQAQKQLEFFRK
ncbi:MAG: TolC family protein [Proteobacteria bacterium]|nr:TolC family protein [Pseudomonadota bacterium]